MSDVHLQLDWRERSWLSSGWRGALGRFELHGMNRHARFENARASVLRLAEDITGLDPDHTVLTGDLSAMGHEDELGLARELLEPLLRAGRLTVIPGNHDRYTDAPGRRVFERTFAPYLTSDLPEYADAQGFPFVRLLGDTDALVGLDSTRVGALTQYFLGRIGRPQLAALSRLLDDPRLHGRTVHVLSHHGPFGPSGAFDWIHSALLDWRELLAVLEGKRVVFHHGHSHHRVWHPRLEQRPHLFGGGSSTEPGVEGYWVLEVDAHDELEAQAYLPGGVLRAATSR